MRLRILILIWMLALLCCACANKEPEVQTQPHLEAADATQAAPVQETTTEQPLTATVSSEPDAPLTTDPTEPPETQENLEMTTAAEPKAVLQFPYAIANTDLVIQQISNYDGAFLEDGTDEEISGVTVMLLRNTGGSGIEYANISLQRGSETLQFEISALPAGASVAVQEKHRSSFVEEAYTDCQADVALLDDFEMSETIVQVDETGAYSLIVTNLSEQTIPAVRLFYKFYMPDQDAYIGGITYTAKLTDLKPGETREITPLHYAQGYSRVMMVRTYETSD